MLTIMASIAQEESRSTSQNVKMGIAFCFQKGQMQINHNRFMGYTKDENKKLVIVPEETEIIKRIYREYLEGASLLQIGRGLESDGILTAANKPRWRPELVKKILHNEKYKGEALLQKSYTVDFLAKKRLKNEGEIQKYYVEDDHDAIIEPWVWEYVQLETERRKQYMQEHGTNSYSHNTENNPFASKIVCGNCNKVFARKGWQSRNGDIRRVWQCSERYKFKGVMGCSNRHVEEATLEKAFAMAWNSVLENRESFLQKWEEMARSEDLLLAYRAQDFTQIVKGAESLGKMERGLMLQVLDHIKIFEDGMLIIIFQEGTEIEYRGI